MTSQHTRPITVAIPTFGRDEVLVDTIGQFLAQAYRAAEILVMDQTPVHSADVAARLATWNASGDIRWLRLAAASQPRALNQALLEATQPVVLFVDDDIRIDALFVEAHWRAHSEPATWAVAGQVLQPGQTELRGWTRRPSRPATFADVGFAFNSDTPTLVENGMSGNLSVRRDRALRVGGFDENFQPPVSYRFDLEFCRRLTRAGGHIRFEPKARIHHLRCERGGTRSGGGHLTSPSPLHGVGDYYFALRQGLTLASVAHVMRRPIREVATRFHLSHPWWIPVKLVGEFRALALACVLFKRGPRYASSPPS